MLSIKLSQLIARLALSMGIRSVNACCCAWYHQPEVPEGMEKFKNE
jgi:cyclic lactone autoinducer peptide